MSKPTNAGVIVALLPDATYTRVRPTIDDHHMTVLYMGGYDDEDINEKALKGYWEGMTKLWQMTLQAEVTGETLFDTPDGWAHVDLINGSFLPDFRGIAQELLDVYGLPLDRRFGFMPHITRRYLRTSTQQEMIHNRGRLKFTFDRMALWAGDTRYEVGLGR